MAYFAEVIDGKVTRILVIDADKVATGRFCDPALMVETFKRENPDVPGQRRSLALVGSTYDPVADEFLPEQPYPSWTLVREDTGDYWEAPKPFPLDDDKRDNKERDWNEETQEWEVV